MKQETAPQLRPGDFIQLDTHFGDFYSEVTSAFGDRHATYVLHDKFAGKHHMHSFNPSTSIRRMVLAEMAVPVIMFKHDRFSATFGQYNPFYGFAHEGMPLRGRAA